MKIDTQKLLEDAYKRYKDKNPETGIGIVSRGCGLSYSTVYNPITNRRKPNVKLWFELMTFFGAVKKSRNKIIIDLSEVG